jgi:hypothetical protein
MTSFSASTRAEAVVLADQQAIWDALVDPDLMARFTPFLKDIRADGEHWLWEMSGINVLGLKVAPAFTERMVFRTEKAGVEGWYELTPTDDGTELVTELEITVDLPLPKASGRAVRATMSKVVDSMGDRFSRRLLDHLGAEQRSG